jgi:hypothetical protein
MKTILQIVCSLFLILNASFSIKATDWFKWKSDKSGINTMSVHFNVSEY